MERLIVMLDEIDLLPFFTLTVFISAINFTEFPASLQSVGK